MAVIFRILLSPLAPFWWLFAALKRWGYKNGIKKRYQSSLSTVVVGNLSMGGTGKTPFSIYLINKLLNSNLEVAYLSRGYGRNTKGLYKVELYDSAQQVGDEALMVKSRFPEIDVIVSENRKEGLQFLEKSSMCRVVVMDDAFQHLRILAHHYFLLSTYQKPFYKDFVFPIGTLREPRFFANNADSVVITKTNSDLSAKAKDSINWAQKKYSGTDCEFSSIEYSSQFISVFTNDIIDLEPLTKVIVLTGIASNKVFVEKVKHSFELYEAIEFPDHHNFTNLDVERILNSANRLKAETDFHDPIQKWAVVTTEKDAIRLQTLETKKPLAHLPLYYWAINLKADQGLELEIDRIIDKIC